MAERYFSKFPIVQYANSAAVNITERAVIFNSALNNPNLYYQYDVTQGQRADQIADNVYTDQYISWLTYLSNGIIDPYYQWYLSSTDFNSFITAKYNTDMSTLQTKIKFYRNNWYNNPGTMPVNQYNALSSSLHKFYEPVYNNFGAVQGYIRAQVDWTINTNSIINYSANGANFVDGELATIHYVTGSGVGEILTANNTNIIIKNVSGHVSDTVTGASYIYGRTSGSNVIFTAVSYLANNIPAAETTYWDAVSIYDYENELNESNKSIRLVNSSYAVPISKQLTKVLNG